MLCHSIWIIVPIFVIIACYIIFIHPFLAVTKPVAANILVIEGWVPDHVAEAAIKEFRKSRYEWFVVSGLKIRDAGDTSITNQQSVHLFDLLIKSGIPRDRLIHSIAPLIDFNRTGAMARQTVKELTSKKASVEGVNVITAGPHARQSWIAYRRLFKAICPVGVISIPKTNYNADRWWMEKEGLKWVNKDFMAYVKELLIGARK